MDLITVFTVGESILIYIYPDITPGKYCSKQIKGNAS